MAAPWRLGAYPYIHDQIFSETNDVDIAFMGDSPLWWGIDTPHVQAELSRRLGRPAVVRSLCWTWSGVDAFYFIGKDLLEHRHVRMIVFCDMTGGTSQTAHYQAMHFFRFGDDPQAMQGLNWRGRTSFYASAILGMPRNLLSALRPDLPAIPSKEVGWADIRGVPNPATRLGSLPVRTVETGVYSDYSPTNRPDPASVCVESENVAAFKFAGQPVSNTQAAFARKIGELAREHQVNLVYLHLPFSSEADESVITESADWRQVFHADISLLGIPGTKLLGPLAPEERKKLFCDFQHLNENGQIYFTSVITDRLLQLYEDQARH